MQKVKAIAISNDDDSTDQTAHFSLRKTGAAVPLTPGMVLGGNLRLEEKLGRGGMGEAWKAYDQTADRHVVLKFVPPEMQKLKEAMESVRSSFQKIHALQHQHICPVYNLVDDPTHGLYIVMKYIDGLTLSEYRRRLSNRNLKMPFNDIVQILWAVAKGLDYAHDRKVIHRDIKPGNIMIGRKDGVQIIDFGLAEEIRTLLSQSSDAVAMSSSGTRPYMAPEQWRGRVQDARTDQYALAVTAYELLAGHVPFSGSDVMLLKNSVLNDVPEPIAGLPEYANAALLKGLSKKRDDRYDNCKAFVRALVTKPESPGTEEIAAKSFPEGSMNISDLPSDRASNEVSPPIWLPQGLSASSSQSKPPVVTIHTDYAHKRALPSWVMPTITALVMLVVCLFGYVVMEKTSKPETPPVVAKKPEQKEPSLVVKEPTGEDKATEPVPEEKKAEPDPVMEEDATTEEPIESPAMTEPELFALPEPVIELKTPPISVAITPEPVEATEARQKYEEEIEQAKKPYREELDKELALARKNGSLNLVLALEAELKHLASDESAKITPFTPEKRVLFNQKARFKNKIEMILDGYKKKLTDIGKELVRTERTEEAKIVQEMLEHVGTSKPVSSAPKRAARPVQPTIRLTLEVQVDGKGRFIAERGSTADQPQDYFVGSAFPMTRFPKVTAFRSENDMGRLLFDMADTATAKEWKECKSMYWHGTGFVQEKMMMQVTSDKTKNSGVRFKIGDAKFPCRFSGEFLIPSQTGVWATSVSYETPDSRKGMVNCWLGFRSNGNIWGHGRCTIPGNKDQDFLKAGPSKDGFVKEFQVPEEMRLEVGRIKEINLGISDIRDNPQYDDSSGLTFVDIVAKFSAMPGLEVESKDKATVVSGVSETGAAFRAGLQIGDEIVRFNGMKRSAEQIQSILANARFGDLITIAVIRDGKEKVLRFHAE